MYYDNELGFLRKMLDRCRVQNTIVDPNASLVDSVDYGLRELFDEEEKNKKLFDYFPEVRPRTVYNIIDAFNCRYILFELPGDAEQFFIIGPYLNQNITEQQILEKGEEMQLPPRLLKELSRFYATVPLIRDEACIFAMVNTFAEFLWNGAENFSSVEINRGVTYSRDIKDINDFYANSVDEAAHMEKRYEFENELISAIAHGNTRKATEMISNISSVAFESRISDQLRSIKNYCIIMNTLFRKAAESGGVHPLHLNNVSSEFAIRIEEIRTVAEAHEFMREILRSYCRLVKHNSVKKFSPIVQKTIIKIELDIAADLSLKVLAKESNVSPNYFSALFKKETGETLTEYVNRKRIEYAKNLLRGTSLQVQTVAQHSGILDLHYFCRLFKKHTGKTPLEYREGFFIN